MSTLSVIEKKPPLAAGSMPAPIVPTTIEQVWRFAELVAKSGMAPKGMEKPETITVAIMHGLEIGLTPLMALQRIAVVNGRPTIWGDAAMALVRASGRCEYVRESIRGEGDAMVAVCVVKRRDETESHTSEFSVADAKAAGLWGKAGPWQQYKKRMLQMRARAFALRDMFADVLGGLYLREEMEGHGPSAGEMRDVTSGPDEDVAAPSRKAPPPPPIAGVASEDVQDAPATAPEAEPVDGEVIPPQTSKAPPPPDAQAQDGADDLEIPASLRRPAPQKTTTSSVPNCQTDPDGFVKWAFAKIDTAADPDALADVWETEITPRTEGLFPPDQTRLRKRYSERLDRIG